MDPVCVVDCKNTLGEGCVWDPRTQSLYWVDIAEAQIFRRSEDGDVECFALPERAAFIIPRSRAGFIVGFASRIAEATDDLKSFETIHVVEPDFPQTRINDATVDGQGGIVFGTFDERDRAPTASLYRLAPDRSLRRLLKNVTISNGLAISQDGRKLFFADTPVGIIRQFLIGPNFESFDEIRPLAGPGVAPGRPDGATVDAHGNYWNARVWGGCVVCIDPAGDLRARIDLPVKGPTCVAFGGPGNRTLFVTSLRINHSGAELEAAPNAGGLFAIEVDVPGGPGRLCEI